MPGPGGQQQCQHLGIANPSARVQVTAGINIYLTCPAADIQPSSSPSPYLPSGSGTVSSPDVGGHSWETSSTFPIRAVAGCVSVGLLLLSGAPALPGCTHVQACRLRLPRRPLSTCSCPAAACAAASTGFFVMRKRRARRIQLAAASPQAAPFVVTGMPSSPPPPGAGIPDGVWPGGIKEEESEPSVQPCRLRAAGCPSASQCTRAAAAALHPHSGRCAHPGQPGAHQRGAGHRPAPAGAPGCHPAVGQRVWRATGACTSRHWRKRHPAGVTACPLLLPRPFGGVRLSPSVPAPRSPVVSHRSRPHAPGSPCLPAYLPPSSLDPDDHLILQCPGHPQATSR